MKLKFRADKKDLMIFGVFSLVLFYLICIGLLNFSSFISDNTLCGFNPLPALGPDYLAATLVLYFAALAGILTSVSSYFFDREKGFGIVSSKKEKSGYSRWLTDKEMKKELTEIDPTAETIEKGGIPLYNNGKHLWVDSGEYHNLIIGSTGSGKTQMMVQPMVSVLAKAGESMIITDPKGEIYEKNGQMLRERGYKIVVLNFRNPLKGNSWNPFSLPYDLYKNGNTDKAVEILEDLGLNVIKDPNNKSGDPFWENTSADYFTGLSIALFDDAKEDEINLNSINLMVTDGDDKCGAASTYAKEYFSSKNKAGTAYVKASSTINAPNETRGSILSVFKQKVNLFASRENLSEMLSHSDFDMKDIGREKTAVFLVIQDEKTTYHPLVTIFLKQCYETLIDVAQECPGGKLPYKTNFILDEFANMPPLKDVTTMVTAARSRNIRFSFIIQNFAQLNDVYGKEQADTIKGNCGNIIYLISSEMSALEEISKMCGEVKSKEKDKTASTPLVTVSDLQRLPQWTVIVLRIRMMPFKAKLSPYFEMANKGLWGKKYEDAPYPERERKEFHVFDIKKFVDQKRQEKMNEIFGGSPSAPSSNPFGGGTGMGGTPLGSIFGDRQEPKSRPTPPPPFPMPGMGGNGEMNVDDILKRIDAKIAELEEEERQEKAKLDAELKKPEKEEAKEVVPEAVFEDKVDQGPEVELPVETEEEPVKEEVVVEKEEPEIEPPKTESLETHPTMNIPVDPIIENHPLEPEVPKEEPKLEVSMVEPVELSKEEVKDIEELVGSMDEETKNNLLKQIDSKIQQLEEEKQETNRQLNVELLKPQKEEVVVSEPTVLPKKGEAVVEDIVPLSDDFITDDQFFDDFFSEEEE